jgi:hypothetical protein
VSAQPVDVGFLLLEQDIYKQWDSLVPAEDRPLIEAYVRGLQSREVKTPKDVEKALNSMRREFKGRRRADGSVQDPPRKSEIIQVVFRNALSPATAVFLSLLCGFCGGGGGGGFLCTHRNPRALSVFRLCV